LPQVLELVERLDGAFETTIAKPAFDPLQVTTIRLKAGDPQHISKMLMSLAPRGTDLRVLADEATRSLWLGGDKDAVARFAKLAEQMDGQAAEGRADARETRFYRLRSADARQLAATINDFMKTMDVDVRVVADPSSNTILAYATTGQNERLAKIIAELDVPMVRTERNTPAGARDGVAAPDKRPD
jgi:type II secretory pathway component GspD/PulD (secretin)